MIKKKVKDFALIFLKAGVGIGIVAYLIYSGKIDVTRILHVFVSSPLILVLIVLDFVTLVVTTWRWQLLLKTQHIHISFKRALKLVFIGHFFNVVIPGSVSGDVVKAYYISKHQKNKMGAALSVVMDRFIGLIVLTGITFGAVLLNYKFITSIPELKILGELVLAGGGVTGLFLVIYFMKKEFGFFHRLKWMPPFVTQLTQTFWSYRNHPKTIGVASLLTVFNFLVNIWLYYLAVEAMGAENLPFIQYFFLIPLGMFVMSLPISPAGLGIGQGVFLKLFEWAQGKPLTTGADMVTLVQMVIICWALVGLCVYILYRERVPEDILMQEKIAL